MRMRAMIVAQELAKGGVRIEPGKAALLATWVRVRHAWAKVGDAMHRAGNLDLAVGARKFADLMPPPLTEKEYLAAKVLEQAHGYRTR